MLIFPSNFFGNLCNVASSLIMSHWICLKWGRWTAITQLTHHGMLFVPIGYTFGADMFSLEQPRGGSPYGAGTFAGDGTKTPTDTELALAEHQGRYTADIVKKLVSNN
jgi:hypothetical protein